MKRIDYYSQEVFLLLLLLFVARCFNCANQQCALSGRIVGGDIDISPCLSSTCPESMRLKKTKTGFMLACTKAGCNRVHWFPKFIKNGTYIVDLMYLYILC